MSQPEAFPYQALIEQNICGIYRTTAAGNIVFCNSAFANMLGYASADELVGTDAGALYFEQSTRLGFVEQLTRTSKLLNYSAILKKKDGSTFYGLENASIFDDKKSGTQYLDGVIIDVSAQMEALTALRESEQKYRRIVETAQEGIWTLDTEDKTNFVNPKLCEMLGYTAEEMMGKELYEFMDEEGKAYAIECMERRRNGAKDNIDIRYKTKWGQDVWCNITTAPIFNAAGGYEGALAMITDISEKRRAAIEKEQLIADLSERNKGFRQFTYIVSHNLRAPVANILSLVSLIREAPSEETAIFLKSIQASALALDTIIKDLHDILRVKNGAFQQREEILFSDLVQSIAGSINLFIHDSGATLLQDFSAVERIFSVRSYLHSIFYNLIVNGIKYARPGVPPIITITSFRENGLIGITFTDNGKGMDLPRVEKELFGLYKRFDITIEGKGMGLFMVKAQVESLGGTITVESQPGAGTTFTILLEDTSPATKAE